MGAPLAAPGAPGFLAGLGAAFAGAVRRTARPARQFLAKQPVKAAKTKTIGLVENAPLKALKQEVGEPGLLVQGIQNAADDVPGGVRVVGQALAVKRLLLPAVVDRGEYLAGLTGGDHLQEHAPAIASWVLAMELVVTVLVGRHAGSGAVVQDMKAANLALGELGEAGMEGDPGSSWAAPSVLPAGKA